MKARPFILLCGTLAALSACNPRLKHSKNAIVTTATPFISGQPKNGAFASATFYDTKYDSIEYRTSRGTLVVANDGTANCIVGRYDMQTEQLLWVAVGGGKGNDRGCNYFILPSENALFAVGYFSDTAYFSYNDGSSNFATLASKGETDIFVARYAYDTGVLQWINGGGSSGRDFGYMYTDPQGIIRYHQAKVCVACDSLVPLFHVWGSCFGREVRFDNASGSADDRMLANDSAKFMRISFDRAGGVATELRLDSLMPY